MMKESTAGFVAVLILAGCGTTGRMPGLLEIDATKSAGRIPGNSLFASLNSSGSEFETAEQLYRSGSCEKSRRILVALLEKNPSHVPAIQLLVHVSRELGDSAAHRDSLKQLIALSDSSGVILNRAGKQLLKADTVAERGRLRAASSQRGDREVDGKSSDDSSAVATNDQSNIDMGIDALKRAVELEPRNPRFAQDLFTALLELNRDDEATQVLQEALKWSAKDPILPMVAARYYESQGDWSTAVKYYDLALTNAPENRLWKRQRGVCHFRRGNWNAARKDLSQALASSSVASKPKEYQMWAEASLRARHFDEAQRVLDRISEESKSESPQTELLRAMCRLEQDQPDEAAAIIAQARAKWPRNVALIRFAGRIEKRSGVVPASAEEPTTSESNLPISIIPNNKKESGSRES